jgi:hypothetical protein
MADPVAGPLLSQAFASLVGEESDSDATDALGVDLLSLIGAAPVGRMVSLSGGSFTREQLQELLDYANAAAED